MSCDRENIVNGYIFKMDLTSSTSFSLTCDYEKKSFRF